MGHQPSTEAINFAGKERERGEIERQIRRFLKRGGQIQQLQSPGAAHSAGAPLRRPVNVEPWL